MTLTNMVQISTFQTNACYYAIIQIGAVNPFNMCEGYYFFDEDIERTGWIEKNMPLCGYIGPYKDVTEACKESHKYYKIRSACIYGRWF